MQSLQWERIRSSQSTRVCNFALRPITYSILITLRGNFALRSPTQEQEPCPLSRQETQQLTYTAPRQGEF